MADTINEVMQVDVAEKQTPVPNEQEQDANQVDVQATSVQECDDNTTNNTATDESATSITSSQDTPKTIDFTVLDNENDEDDVHDEKDEDEDEKNDEEEEEGDDESDHSHNINPLNHSQVDMEMETIRNSYRNSESDLNDSEEASEDGTNSSPSPAKRVTMWQDVPLPDDFILGATLAIRTSILAGDSKRRFLDDTDFQATRKYRISMAGDKKSEIKDYAPVVFSHIRKKYGITMQSYLMSWSDDKLIKHKASGKSDAQFVHSPDGKYILKTIPKDEASRLRKILADYYQHLETQPDSLLSKIFGLHRVARRRGLPRVYFAIFNNVFDTHNSFSEIFDLKGSTVGRRASIGENVMKDLDLGEKQRIHLAPHVKTRILEQIASDCKFLAKHHLMDYSLLVGIRRNAENATSDTSSTKTQSPDQRLPGLLFFLESTKKIDAGAGKRVIRRKSMTMGKPIFASMDDLREGIEELESEDKPSTNTSVSNLNESSNSESATSPDLTADSPDRDKPQEVVPEEPKLRKIALSESNLNAGNTPANKHHPPLQTTSVLKGVLKRGASECRLVQSSSAPHLNTRKDANGAVYINDPSVGHVPFYQQDEGGIKSSQLLDNSANKYYEVYHFGIIDFLQKYNKKKKIANFAKSLKYEKDQISTVDPVFYMSRFLKMAEKVVGLGP